MMELKEKNKIIKSGKLLMKTNGNWDYYLYNGKTYAIATDPQCESCWFGGPDHFRKIYRKYWRDHMEDNFLTEIGKEILGIYL